MTLRLHPPADGPPCGFVRPFLDRAADGRARGLGVLYALAHAARCSRCRRYLDSLAGIVEGLADLRESETDADAIRRLGQRL